MKDRKLVVIAVAAGVLTLAANGAAAAIAISASSAPPEAATFGIIGLTAAFIGLILTMVWAFREEAQPAIRRERVFTPWSEREDGEPMLFAEPYSRTPLALARAPAPAPIATPAADDGRVVYIAEWRKTRGIQHA
jgi:hypothetical protein